MLEKVVRTVRRGAVASVVTLGISACFVASALHSRSTARPAHRTGPDSTLSVAAPKLARPSTPRTPAALTVFRAANRARGMKILVSTEDRWLWLVRGRDTVMSVPVAVGMGESFSYSGRKWFF